MIVCLVLLRGVTVHIANLPIYTIFTVVTLMAVSGVDGIKFLVANFFAKIYFRVNNKQPVQ